MGYYLGQSFMAPRAGIGAQGGFFSSIGNFLGRAVGTVTRVASGPVGQVVGAITGHPIVSAAAGAATAAAVTTAVTHHTGVAATAGVGRPVLPSVSVHGHLHVGGKRGAAAAPGGRRRRRMNPCNVHALRRAIRRAHGFERIAKKVLRFTSPHRKAKPHGFKRPRKRATV